MCNNSFRIHKVVPRRSNLCKMGYKLDYQIYAISLQPLLMTKERETLFYSLSSIHASLCVELVSILKNPFCCILRCIKLTQVNRVMSRCKQKPVVVCSVEHFGRTALELNDYLVCSVHSNSISPVSYTHLTLPTNREV